jgi:hypothetical protein
MHGHMNVKKSDTFLWNAKSFRNFRIRAMFFTTNVIFLKDTPTIHIYPLKIIWS